MTQSKKSFSLLQYFSVVSLVSILLAAILLGLFYRYVSISQLVQHGEQNNIVLAQTLSNTIWPKFKPFAALTKKLEPIVLREHSETRKLRKFVVTQIDGTPVIKVKIFDLQGLTLFSTELEQIGNKKPSNYPGNISAQTGEVISKLSFREEFLAINNLIANRQVISSYLPIRDRQQNKIEGVFEVYYDVTELFSDIGKKQFYISAVVVLILGLLYVLLFFFIRHADRIIKVQEEELTITRDDALKANAAKSSFLANMSHEIRTPLNAIIGYSELIHEELSDDMQGIAPDLKKIRDAGDHLLNLINTVLDISKIESGKTNNYIETIDIALTIKKLASTIEPLVQKNNNTLVVECSSSLGEMESDLTKFRQIFLNITSNAAKFTHNGNIKVQIRAENHDEKEWIILTVSDDGIGMTAKQQSKIFDDFSQADESTTRKFGGTGLGLSISKRLCVLLGGEISVESEPDYGSTFTVVLPRYTPKTPLPEEKHIAVKPKIKPDEVQLDVKCTKKIIESNTNCRVLMIDDDVQIHDFLGRFLIAKGFSVESANDADTGIQLARTLQPSVILLDIMMPKKDGYAALAELKADSELCKIPVIILSLVADKERSLFLGAEGCIEKPVELDSLADSINSLVAATK